MGAGARVLYYDEFMQMEEHVFDVTLPMASLENCTIVFVSSSSTNINSHGLRILSARYKHDNQPVVRILTTGNPDELSDTLNTVSMDSDTGKLAKTKKGEDESNKNYSIIGLAVNNTFNEIRKEYANDLATVLKSENGGFMTVGLISPHQSAIQMRKIEALMSTKAYEVELLNKATGADKTPAFNYDSLNSLLQSAPFTDKLSKPPFVIVTFDPAGGGDLSDSAWCSAFYTDDGKMVILGADVATEEHYMHSVKRVYHHISWFREKIHGLKNIPVLFVVENNYGSCAPVVYSQMVTAFKQYEPGRSSGIYFYFDAKERLGFTTDNPAKAGMVRALDARLRSSQICYHEKFFNVNEAYSPDEMKLMLHKQLCDYMRRFVRSDHMTHGGKEYYGGKPKKDDLAISLQINAYVYTETIARNLLSHQLESMSKLSMI